MLANRKGILIFSLLLLLLVLTACAASQSEPAASQPAAGTEASAAESAGPSVIRYPITSDPSSLEPGLVLELFAGQIALDLHAGLFTYDQDTNLTPYIVRDWDVSDDGIVYTFNLRDDVLWHNGRAVVANDFKVGWERYLNPEVGAQSGGEPFSGIVGAEAFAAGEADELTGVEAVDDHTLRVTLTEEDPYFLQNLAITTTWVVPSEAVVEGRPEWVGDPVGAGPFKFVEWQPNVKIVLEANPDFFLGKPAIDRIEYVIVPDDNTALAQYEAGELDIVPVPPSDLQRISEDATLSQELGHWTRAQLRYAGMNQSMFEPFKDARVRQAFNYAIDRQTIIENILNNAWEPATGIVPPNIPEYNPDLEGYPYDPEKAQELMAEAGYPDGQGFPPLQIATLETTTAEAIAAQLSGNLGIEVEVTQPERGDMIDGLWGHDRWQFFFFGWTADRPSAAVWLYELLYGGLESNFSTYDNPDYNALIDQARSTTDLEESKGYWQEAEALAMDDAAMIPFGYSRYTFLIKPGISGFGANLFGPVGFAGVSKE